MVRFFILGIIAIVIKIVVAFLITIIIIIKIFIILYPRFNLIRFFDLQYGHSPTHRLYFQYRETLTLFSISTYTNQNRLYLSCLAKLN